MKRSLVRLLTLAAVLSVTTLATASTEQGLCRIHCWSGATAGPYWSTDESCCADFEALCGAAGGEAYTQFGYGYFESRSYCPENMPPI